MKKAKTIYYYLSLLVVMMGYRALALAKDPFQPFDSSKCVPLTTQLNGWELNAVLISPTFRYAILSHRLLGIRQVEVASLPSFVHGHVTKIEWTHIQITALPPCPENGVKLSFKGVL